MVEARQIITWYRMRWTIEQVFRSLKSHCLDIETSQMEKAAGFLKLAVVALIAAVSACIMGSSRLIRSCSAVNWQIVPQMCDSRRALSPGDAGKKIKGIKRHILVGTVGLLLHAKVHPADIQDSDGGVLLLSTLFGLYPFPMKLFADAGYQGPQFAKAVAKVLPHRSVEIVKRSDHASGFVVLPMRWVVERTLAWLNRCRRLAKDFENLSRTALAFLQLASIRLMLRKLCNPV